MTPIEFIIPPQTEKWKDLNKSNNTWKWYRLQAHADVLVVNNLFHSLFTSIDLYLNKKLFTSNIDTYPYGAYIENLLPFSHERKISHP